jgi:type III secretion protein Q
VVLPGMRWAEGQLGGPLELHREGTVLEGTLGAAGWTVRTLDGRRNTEVTCVDPQLSSLPVELEVELARVPFTLGELAALAPGTVIALRISPGDPVFLRAGDRRVARAELVDLEGEVGARILALLE